MQLTHAIDSGLAPVSGSTAHCQAAPMQIQLLCPGDADVQKLRRFIAEIFARTYSARVEHFATHLVGMRTADGGWAAGLGYTPAGRDSLFIEQYLDRPIESIIAARIGVAVRRDDIVEVGNLAAINCGAARQLIVRMTELLHQLGRSWVVFTATQSLINSFRRLDIPFIPLAHADRQRLPDGGRSWGSYYGTDPRVATANIALAYAHLFESYSAPRAA